MTAPARETREGRRFLVSNPNGWDTERWLAVLVIGCLGMLIMIRMGFRGINVAGVRAEIT